MGGREGREGSTHDELDALDSFVVVSFDVLNVVGELDDDFLHDDDDASLYSDGERLAHTHDDLPHFLGERFELTELV